MCWWRFYLPAMTDFTMMVENNSYMFVTGPNVVKPQMKEVSQRIRRSEPYEIWSGAYTSGGIECFWKISNVC
jgi:propionyl-CoA carboxylase beta chain